MATAATSARKRGVITWQLPNDSENVFAFSGSERNYKSVATLLGMTVYADGKDVKIPDGKKLQKKTKVKHVIDGSANVYTAEIRKGARESNTDILIPTDKIDDVLNNGILNGKSYAGGTIQKVRGKVQRVVSV